MTEEQQYPENLEKENKRLKKKLQNYRAGIKARMTYRYVRFKLLKLIIPVKRLIAITLIFITFFEGWLLYRQYQLANNQNLLVERQNLLVEHQNQRLDQQTYLQEADRRSALVMLMANIFDEVNNELREERNIARSLSPQLIGRIIGLSYSFTPYKFLVGDELTPNEYSPERGQLLIALVNSSIDTSSLGKIYKKADFSRAYLVKARLDSAYLKGVNLSAANLEFAYMVNANLSNAHLTFANLKSAYLFNADLSDAYLENADLISTNLSNANLTDTRLHEANLQKADLSKAVLVRTRLISSNLVSADLQDAILQNARLAKANLSSVNLINADLQGATFWDATLQHADLTYTDLANADLKGADLINAKITRKTKIGLSTLNEYKMIFKEILYGDSVFRLEKIRP